MRCVRNLECLATQHRNKFVVDYFYYLLPWIQRSRRGRSHRISANSLNNIAHNANIDVSFKQRCAHFSQDFNYIAFGKSPAVTQPF